MRKNPEGEHTSDGSHAPPAVGYKNRQNSAEIAARNIKIVFLGIPNTDRRKEIWSCASRIFGNGVEIGNSQEAPQEAFNTQRNQWNAKKLLHIMRSKRNVSTSSMVFYILEGDAYIHGMDYVFAASFFGGNISFIFTARLSQGLSKSSSVDQRFQKRLEKELVHEFGHLRGLEHCPDEKCVMNHSISIVWLDKKGINFCVRCYKLMHLAKLP